MAAQAHAGQAYGSAPYTVHLDAVVSILNDFFTSPNSSVSDIAGYLHDAVEDTSLTVEDVRAKFGDSVSQIVEFLSDEPGKNRKEKKEKTYYRMRSVISKHEEAMPEWLTIAIAVKCADRLANMLHSLTDNKRLFVMYQEEFEAFYNALYVPGIADKMWAFLRSLVDIDIDLRSVLKETRIETLNWVVEVLKREKADCEGLDSLEAYQHLLFLVGEEIRRLR